MLDVWNKAVFYHLIHALALLVLALFGAANRSTWWLLFAGIFIFSGSLIRDGADKYPVARSDYAHRRSLFSCRLGVARDCPAPVDRVQPKPIHLAAGHNKTVPAVLF